MTASFLGVFLAIGAALSAATMSLCIRLGTQKSQALHAVMIAFVFNTIVFVPLALIAEYPTYEWNVWTFVWFGLAGLSSTFFGRLSYFYGIQTIGASRTEPLRASQPIFATLMALFILNESLNSIHFSGIVLIIAGVAYLSWETSRNRDQNPTTDHPVRGILLGFSSALFFGMAPVLVKLGLSTGVSFITGVAIKTLVAFLAFSGFWWGVIVRKGYSIGETFRNEWFLLAGLLNCFFQGFYYSSLTFSPVVVSIPIIQLSPLFVLLISFWFIPRRLEKITVPLILSCVVVVLGAILVTVFSQ